MKKVSRFFMVLMVLAIAIPGLNSCKKGENDPFLSLKSRDSRITGEWKLTKVEGTQIQPNFSGSGSTTATTTYDGTTMTTTVTGQTTPITSKYSLTITLEKDGNAKVNEVEDTDTDIFTTRWYWLESAKSKMWINIAGDEYLVDQLKNKELVLVQKSESTSTVGSTTRTSSSSFTYTFEKQ